MTVLEAVRWAARALSACDSPRTDAELLMCSLLGLTRSGMLLRGRARLSPPQLKRYRKMVAARRERIPLQHITAGVEFMAHEFAAGPEAMVPRPETETLYQMFVSLLPPSPGALLDLGTGSGVLGVSLALRFPRALVVGVELSREATALARSNARSLDASGFRLVVSDLTGGFSRRPLFDGIVANLPYIPSGVIPGLQPEVRDGDPPEALDGGPDGLDLVRRALDEVPDLLRSGGVLALELGEGQCDRVSDLIRSTTGWETGTHPDLSGRPRVVTSRKA
ncbi:peptide chain release factor N(5)-glutamine methyltransferase [Candidatus Fermentibacteria bacterium]|nr:peptide chain release factor N(5)-glutamine methyltransferase [Candidatus Fermentibacteria bacterium]